MAKENNVEYERVDEEGDDYRRILVKFNPHFLRDPDFEIEFIPFYDACDVGKVFVTEIDSMSSSDLYRWACRQRCLTRGIFKYDSGAIPPIKTNKKMAEMIRAAWRGGKEAIEPRQIISRVKRIYEITAKEFSPATAYAFNYFLLSGQLGSMSLGSKEFTKDYLKYVIEELPFHARDRSGEWVERPLVPHLFDVHKTKYVVGAINNFLERVHGAMCRVIEEYEKQQRE